MNGKSILIKVSKESNLFVIFAIWLWNNKPKKLFLFTYRLVKFIYLSSQKTSNYLLFFYIIIFLNKLVFFNSYYNS